MAFTGKSITDSMPVWNGDPLTYEDLTEAQRKMNNDSMEAMRRRYEEYSPYGAQRVYQQRQDSALHIQREIPTDSPVTRVIRKRIKIDLMKRPDMSNPYGDTNTVKASIDIPVEFNTTYQTTKNMSDSSIEKIKDEILAIARQIVRERKGLE